LSVANGLLLVAHGSRSAAGQTEMQSLAQSVATMTPSIPVELGFLELADPPASVALDRLVAAGATRIGVVPLMLFSAGHSKSDVPAVVLHARDCHPDVVIRYGRPLGVDHSLVLLARQRVQAVDGDGLPLVVLGRGTSDPEANADGYKASRLLAEATGAPVVVTGYSGVTWPTVPEALDQLRRVDPSRIVAFAWFMATGVLIERMRDDFAQFTAATGIEVLDAGYFGPAPELAAIVLDRCAEALDGSPAMNCDVCVYRKPFPGLEARAAQPLGVGHSHLAFAHRSSGHLHGDGASTASHPAQL